MITIQFDHFLTATSAANLDDYLQEYAVLGFQPEEQTVRHDPGLRTGFIFLGPEYIEFCWVEDRQLFAQGDEKEKLTLSTPRPFGIGLQAQDIHALHADWIARGFSVPEVWSKAPRDAAPDAPPVWSFQDIPADLLPGVDCFALTYHLRKSGTPRRFLVHPNTVYALAGVVFVTEQANARAHVWHSLLTPHARLQQTGHGFDVCIGPHLASWITPDDYQAAYGLPWLPSPHPYGDLAVLHLLAADLEAACGWFERGGRRTAVIQVGGNQECLIAPEARDGFVFSIREQPVERWLQERTAITGEQLLLKEAA